MPSWSRKEATTSANHAGKTPPSASLLIVGYYETMPLGVQRRDHVKMSPSPDPTYLSSPPKLWPWEREGAQLPKPWPSGEGRRAQLPEDASRKECVAGRRWIRLRPERGFLPETSTNRPTTNRRPNNHCTATARITSRRLPPLLRTTAAELPGSGRARRAPNCILLEGSEKRKYVSPSCRSHACMHASAAWIGVRR
ncbi:hypothetical protein D1007_05446 [Hordeum vulgare]|nr:hypothetical protein D1007_05446 [Hordeum vulgare]